MFVIFVLWRGNLSVPRDTPAGAQKPAPPAQDNSSKTRRSALFNWQPATGNWQPATGNYFTGNVSADRGFGSPYGSSRSYTRT